MPQQIRYTKRIRVQESDIDLLGHTNNVIYLTYLQSAASEHASHLGFNYERMRQLGGIFVVRRHEIEYFRQSVYGDELDVTTWVDSMDATRSTRCYEIHHAENGSLIVRAATLWVWMDFTGRPRRIPNAIRAVFSPLIAADTGEHLIED